MSPMNLDRKLTALLIADFYAAVMGELPHAVDRHVLENTARLQRAARSAGILVCYCATVFRPSYIEINDRNKILVQRKYSGHPTGSEPLPLIHKAVAPIEGEVVIGKHRINALYGTGLDVVLRANGIENLILLGYATSGVVLSTLRHAADLDYRLFVVEDCCADPDADVHEFLMQRLFSRQADIVTSAQVIQALES